MPVLAAGGLADGAGLAAALMLGAEGVLLGTRFLATPEAPVTDAYKQALVASDGHDTLLSEVPDLIGGRSLAAAPTRASSATGSSSRGPAAMATCAPAGRRSGRACAAHSRRATRTGARSGRSERGPDRQHRAGGRIVERIVREAEAIMQERIAIIR